MYARTLNIGDIVRIVGTRETDTVAEIDGHGNVRLFGRPSVWFPRVWVAFKRAGK